MALKLGRQRRQPTRLRKREFREEFTSVSEPRLTFDAVQHYSGPSSSSSPAPAGASWWTPRRKSSIGVSGRDAHSRPPHARPTRAATSFNPVASSPSSSSSSPSDVHAAATALTGLSEDGFESALALSRQWRRGAFVAQGPRGSSAPLPPTHRSIPVVCRGSASWDEYEDDMWSPSSADTFEADDYDQDGIYECAQQMPTSRSSSIAESRRGSLFLSSLLPPDALARRLSGSLSLSVEGYDPTPEQSRGPSLCCSSLRGSSASSSCGLRFKPSLNPRGSAGSAFSLQLDAGDDEDDAEHVAAHGDDGGDVTRCTPSICPDALNSIADELAWISERAMSDSYPSSFTEAVADEDAAF